MQEGTQYCLIPAAFWNAWLRAVKSTRGISAGGGPALDPTRLLEAGHSKKLAKVFDYPDDVVAVPPRYGARI